MPWLLLWLAGPGWAATTVLQEGRVLLPVRVAEEAAPEVVAAAQELARVLGRLSGVEWPVLTGGEGAAGLQVGGMPRDDVAPSPALAADFLAPRAGEWGPDAFRIRTRGGSVFIEAATPAATGYAVAWFLQRYAGVRWYAPGEAGEVIPSRRDWILPDIDLIRQPAYVSREIHPAGSADEQAWARRNGLRGRLEFAHALDRVFPPAVLAEHAQWRPWVRGQRLPMPERKDRNWQPNLALPAVARHAAHQALAAFDADPELPSFSLGINDSLRFDQGPVTASVVAPLRYFRGMPDYSPLVFGFMNRAAAAVAARHGDRYLGCLAYFWCENVPPFPVHPQVVPYVTTDRAQYHDPAYRAADLALMTGWQGSGVRTYGLWEYAYGEGFLVPRITLSFLAEGIREGWHRGARGYFAEMGPQAGFDAFKRWMIAQLLWEPDRSVWELAEDFYPGYYGRAAEPMREFFEACEERWQEQGGPAYWLKYYRQADQARLFPPEVCVALREKLIAARTLADRPAAAFRVEQTARAFAVTEALAQVDAVRQTLSGAGEMGEASLVQGATRWLQAARDLRRAAERACAGEEPALTPMRLEPFLADDPVPRLLGQAGQGDPGAARRILQQIPPDLPVPAGWWRLADVLASARLATTPSVLINGTFNERAEQGLSPGFLHVRSAEVPAGWDWQVVPTERSLVALGAAVDEGGNRTLRIEGAWSTQYFQWVRAIPGQVYVGTAQLRGDTTPGGEASLYLSFLTSSGEMLGPTLTQSLPKGANPDWRTLVLAERAPAAAAWVGVGFGATRQVGADWLEVKAVALRGMPAEGADR